MSKTLKKVFLWLLAFTAVLCVTGLVACKNDKGKTGAYTITITASENGTVTSDVSSADEGDTVTLTVTPADGYALEQLLVNSVETEVTDGSATFVMPSANVTVSATFVSASGSFAVNIGDATGGTVKADKTKAQAGTTVTLTVTPDYGYELKSLKVNGNDVTVTNGTATFTMPAAAASVVAVFELSEGILVESAASGTLNLESKALAGSTATAKTAFEFGESSLGITVWVEDIKVLSSQDAYSIYIGRNGYEYTNLSSVNYGVKVCADGTVTQYEVKNGAYSVAATGAFTASVTPWAKTSGTVDGYKVTLSVPYETIGLTADTVKGNVTVLPVLSNADSALGVKVQAYGGYSVDFPGSYLVLNDATVWEENYYALGLGQLGGNSLISAGSKWDLSRDYAEADTENYANRTVTLSGGSDGDNNLVFFRTTGKEVYAKATFRLDAVYNNEHAGKFGLMLYDGANQKGVFFYVDALGGKQNNVADITGTALGYNVANGSWGTWTTATGNGVFDLTTKTITLAMSFYENLVSLYYTDAEGNDILVTSTVYVPNGDVSIGIKSFNYGLTVTDYVSLSNHEDTEFADHISVRANGDKLGDNSTAGYYYTSGWTFEEGVDAANYEGTAEQAIYYRNQEFATDLYFEVDFKSTANTGTDELPKAGLILRNDNITVLAYFDLNSGRIGNVGIVYRASGSDWSWSDETGGIPTGADVTNGFVNVAIAKRGNVIYMFVNGDVVAQKTISSVTANSAFVAGIMCFNRIIEVKNATFTTDAQEIDYNLVPGYNITVPELSGVEIGIASTKVKVNDTVNFTVDTRYTVTRVAVKYNGEEHVLEAENGTYSFVMPSADAEIVVTVDNMFAVTIDSSLAGKVAASQTLVEDGTEITFSVVGENVAIGKLYANEVEIVRSAGGGYALTVNEDVTITGVTYYTTDGVVLDGEVDEKYGTVSTTALYSDDRTIEVYAVKLATGVAIRVQAVMNTTKTDSANWWENTNFEFQLNASGQRYLNINGTKSGVTEYIWNTEILENGKYQYTVELFVASDLIEGFDNGDVQLNYAWKTLDETAMIEGDLVRYVLAQNNQDWLCLHAVGGLEPGNETAPTELGGYVGMPRNLHISSAGLVIGVEPENGTVDANLEEFENKASVTVGDSTKTTVEVTGYAADDGLYLGFTITHGAWSPRSNVWSENDNLEFRLNGYAFAILFFDGKLVIPSIVSRGSAVTVEQDGKNVTTVELFIPGSSDIYSLQMGIAGTGFGGWQAAIWDSNKVYVTDAGVSYSPVPAGIALDGNLNDSVYTETVTGNKISATANDATVEVIGVKTSTGVLLGITVKHAKAISEFIQEDGTLW